MRVLLGFCAASLAFCLVCMAEEESSWIRVSSPTEDPLHNGFFLDDDHGWIISYGTGLVLRTVDGGDTWTIASRLDSIFYECIFFSDRNTGWVCGENGSFLQTQDGGWTWQRIELALESYAFYGIHVPEQGRGFLVGMDVSNRKAVMYESTDRGETWIERKQEFPGACFEPIQFLDANRGFMAGGKYVLRTTDGGESWIANDLEEGAVIRGLHFASLSHGWAVGHGGDVFHTADSGRTWRTSERFTSNRLRSVRFVDEKRGFIVGDQNKEPGSLWWTDDGGEKWNRSAEEFPDLHRLFQSPQKLWAVGKAGTILKYTQ
ncbi:hypothetical protein KKH27_10610 [bacterium]|nr:hypothetical protein [bacterium]MBU1985034.1 hypothetical protein [bacterium]